MYPSPYVLRILLTLFIRGCYTLELHQTVMPSTLCTVRMMLRSAPTYNNIGYVIIAMVRTVRNGRYGTGTRTYYSSTRTVAAARSRSSPRPDSPTDASRKQSGTISLSDCGGSLFCWSLGTTSFFLSEFSHPILLSSDSFFLRRSRYVDNNATKCSPNCDYWENSSWRHISAGISSH